MIIANDAAIDAALVGRPIFATTHATVGSGLRSPGGWTHTFGGGFIASQARIVTADGAELRSIYKASDVVVVPSRNEPFGIVILEAWSAAKPVVATKRGGPAEFVWHEVNGLHVDDSPDSVAWGLGTLLADHGHCRWMGRNGRAAVDAVFSWDCIAEQTESVYQRLS